MTPVTAQRIEPCHAGLCCSRLITGHVKKEILERVSLVSNYAYIVKPVHRGQIKAALALALRKNADRKALTDFQTPPLEQEPAQEEAYAKNGMKMILSPAEYRIATLAHKGG